MLGDPYVAWRRVCVGNNSVCFLIRVMGGGEKWAFQADVFLKEEAMAFVLEVQSEVRLADDSLQPIR